MRKIRQGLLAALALAALPLAAAAHVTVWPKVSDAGGRERYAIRVPNEKAVATVRVEAQFPEGLRVTSFEQKAGWSIEVKRNAANAITGATWSGELPPDQFTEFGVLAVNPAGKSLTWTFVQTYADGTKVEWSGPADSPTPAPQVSLRPPEASAQDHH